MNTSKTTVSAEALTKGIVAVLPEVQARLMSLLGRRPKRLSRRHQVIFERKLQRFADAMFGEIEQIQNSSAGTEPDKVAGIIECLLSSWFQAAGIRRKPGEDTLDLFMRLALKQTAPPSHPWAKRPEYQRTRQTLWDFVIQMHQRIGLSAVRSAFEHWAEREGEGHISFTRQLDTAASRFRMRPPIRLTDRLVVDLQHEYRLVSAFFESRLRLLIYLAREGTTKSKPWSEWKRETLNNLLEMAKTEPSLATIVGAIDRQVRNGLAHGAPTIDMITGAVVFHDSRRAIRWTFQEFFERTRGLTVTVAALGSLEPFMQFAQTHWLISTLRSLKAPCGTPSPAPKRR